MAVTIDQTTWYTILNNASHYDLALLPAPAVVNWQFLCPNQIDPAYPAEQFIIRPQGYQDLCLTPVPSTSSLGIAPCDPSKALWEVSGYVNPDGGSGFLIWNQTWGYLSASCDTCSTFVLHPNLQQYPAAAIAEFSFSSVSPVNDASWQTLPWPSSGLSSPSTTTSQPLYIGVSTSDSAPALTSNTPESAPTSISSTDNGKPTPTTTTTITISSSSSTPATVTTAPPLSLSIASPGAPGTTYFSVVGKNLDDALGPTVADLLLPEHVNLGCEQCIGIGNIDVTSSDIDTTYGDDVAVADFLKYGYINMNISNFAALIDVDVELLPGFELVDKFIAFYNTSLGTIDIAKDLTLEFTLAIGIPLEITLDSTVIFTGGYTINIDQANIHLDVGDFSSSTVSGFDTTQFKLGDFSVSAPNLAFTVETGLALRIYVTATATADVIDVEGKLTFEVAIPSLNLTAAVDSNVDDDCKPGGKHTHAIDLSLETKAKISVEGELSLKCEKPSVEKTLNSTEFVDHEFPIDVPDEEQCLYDSRLKAAFLGVAAAASGAAGAAKGEAGRVAASMMKGEVVWGFVALWSSAFLWVEIL